jgi:hypothetical protein
VGMDGKKKGYKPFPTPYYQVSRVYSHFYVEWKNKGNLTH